MLKPNDKQADLPHHGTGGETHEVFNQPKLYGGYNIYKHDVALQEAVRREGSAWAESELNSLGDELADPKVIRQGYLANKHTPELRSHDDFGNRINEIETHPAWNNMLEIGRRHKLHSQPWVENRPGAHVSRAVKCTLMSQVESGVLCPINMTYSGIPVLRDNPAISEQWEPLLMSPEHDARYLPAGEKSAAMIGMAMTEKQGGSDLRANTTVARPTAEEGVYQLTGHKWFFSAPLVDCFLTVAHVEGAPGQISCFFVPFWLPDGSRNRFSLIRLKDKLGNRSNPSSEIEYNGTLAWRIGEEGRGIRTIIKMVSLTRLGCASISSGIMRQTLFRALHHTQQRSAFGAKLIDKPLMKNVLADLALESEASTALFVRLAGSVDRAATDESEKRYSRVATALTKYWLAKRASPTSFEALECHGGYGYIEDSMMPRFYRESPLHSIWEGSGNVICLDVLRAMEHDPQAMDPVLAEIELAKGANPHLDRALVWIKDALTNDLEQLELIGRRVFERIAVALQAALLVRHSPAYVADAFCASRLGGDWGQAFGTLGADVEFKKIIDRSCGGM